MDAEWNLDDVIKMEVNSRDNTLRYWTNGKEIEGIFGDGIDFKQGTVYHLAVALYAKGESVALLAFKMTSLD